ncbi:membrane protein, partial [Candidatus Magnetobacterium bavaricum]
MAAMAAGLFFMDVLLAQGFFSIVTIMFILPVLLVLALVAWKEKELMKQRFVGFCISLFVVFITLATVRLSNVENPQNIIISQENRDLIDLLLLERMALAAIVRVTGVSERWLQ